MLAVVGVGAASSSPGSAQPVTSSIEVVSATADGAPTTPANLGPRVSDDGTIVVFDSSATIDDPTSSTSPPTSTSTPVSAPTTGVVMIRDRQADTTARVPDEPSLRPGVSGDGCIVAYSVPTTAGQVQLTALDRCGPVGGSLIGSTMVVDTVAATGALAAPALSEDGSVIVWSTGSAVTRYVASATGYDELTIPMPRAVLGTSGIVAGSAVDVSDDGDVVVFVAGPGTVGQEPDPANVFVSSADPDGAGPLVAVTELVSATTTGAPGSDDSTSPSVSGDGRIVVFESSSADIAAEGSATAQAPFVVVSDRERGTANVLVDDAARPSISGDGTVVVYDTSTDVRLQRWVGGGDEPFASVSDASLSIGVDGLTSAGPSIKGPVVSRDGSLAVFDHANGAALTTDARFAVGAHVWARTTIEDPPPGTTTTTTTQPSPPTTTPSGGSTPTPPSTAVRTSVPPASTGSTTTTVPSSSQNRPTPPSSSSGSRPSSGSGSTGSGSRPVGTGSTSTFSTGPIESVAFVPSGVEFSPTIIGAGRQSAVLSLSNPTSSSVTVTAIAFDGDPDGAFTVTDNACEPPVPPLGSCDVTVSYAPVIVGDASAQIVATLSDGRTVYGDLAGTGAPPPVVSVVPGVASSGQVVAIQGSGFPVGLTVELSWLGQEPARRIQLDASGSFVETAIVMSHTPRGPATVAVFGQQDLFDTVVGEVLITTTSARSSSTLTQPAGGRFAS